MMAVIRTNILIVLFLIFKQNFLLEASAWSLKIYAEYSSCPLCNVHFRYNTRLLNGNKYSFSQIPVLKTLFMSIFAMKF